MSTLLKRVTLAIAAILVAIAMMLSILSVSTDLWITASVGDITLQQGLWRGCLQTQGHDRECIRFDNDVIKGTVAILWH